NSASDEMRPNDIGQVAGEIWILRRGHPTGERLATGLAFDFGEIAAEKLWRHDCVRHRVFRVAIVAVENDGLARVVAGLAANLREEGREPVVIVHRPAVE